MSESANEIVIERTPDRGRFIKGFCQDIAELRPWRWYYRTVFLGFIVLACITVAWQINDPEFDHRMLLENWPVAVVFGGYVAIFVGGPYIMLRAIAGSFWNSPFRNKSTVKVTLSEKGMSWTVNNHTTAIGWNDIAFVEVTNTSISFAFKVSWIESVSLPEMSNDGLIGYCKQLRQWGVTVKQYLPEETEER